MQIDNILSRFEFDVENGALLLDGVRYLLIRPETIIGFQKEVESMIGQKACWLFYRGGFEGGSRSGKKLFEQNQLNGEQTIQAMCAMGTQIGWGAFQLARFSETAQQFEITIASSPWAQAYGASATPVCHLVAGVFAGVASVIFNREVPVIETACAASGSRLCTIQTVEEQK